MGPKSLRVAGAGWGVLRAALTWISPDLEPDRAPACAAPEPRTLLEVGQTHVESGFVLFCFSSWKKSGEDRPRVSGSADT